MAVLVQLSATGKRAAAEAECPAPRAWWLRLLLVLLLGALQLGGHAARGEELAVAGTSVAAESLPREYQLKAAFLYNFTKFVDWPGASFSSPQDPIVIGVLGPAEFSATLERIVRNRQVNGHAILVKRVAAADGAGAVHVLFVTAAEDALFEQIRAGLATSPILTVGESESFRALGGAINFVLEEGKVRFEIDAGAAERSGLRISAQLQKLARAVRRAP
jgi:hypothetical protein